MPSAPPRDHKVFDRQLARQRRQRAASKFDQFDFLLTRIVDEWRERLLDLKRDFPRVWDTSAHLGHFAVALSADPRFQAHPIGSEIFVQSDLSLRFAQAARKVAPGFPTVVADEEWVPFREASFDLITSALTLHHVNDLPGALIQIRRALKPDGLFLAAFFGGETLTELRSILLQAESEIRGGVSPRIAPFVDIRDLGSLLQRAGFALPVIDTDTLTVDYADLMSLFRDLRGMGQTNVLTERSRQPLTRTVLARASQLYTEKHGRSDGRITVSFEILYAAGWAPHHSQQKPLAPGSGKIPLGAALKKTSKGS